MIMGRTVLALVPARRGSKGFPGKNLAKLGGRSLIARAVLAARGSAYVDRVAISSDCPDMVREALNAGADMPIDRPVELASDEATAASVVLHALEVVSPRPDFVVLLQPTSPLRTAEDIDNCLKLCIERGARACVSVVEVEQHPFLMFWRGSDGSLRAVVEGTPRPSRRQDMPPAYMLNGAVYVARVAEFLTDPVFAPPGSPSVVMPAERSIDIDDPEDLLEAERLLV